MEKLVQFRNIALAATLAGLSTAAMAIDCRKATTPTDHRICDDARVLSLDQQLSLVFESLVASATPPADAALRTAQRAWLKESRDRCGDADCLVHAYDTRLEALRRSLDDGVPALAGGRVDESPLTRAQAAHACGRIVDRINRGQVSSLPSKPFATNAGNDAPVGMTASEGARLEKSRDLRRSENAYRLRLRNDAPPARFVQFETGGSCASTDVVNVDYLLAHESSSNDDSVVIGDRPDGTGFGDDQFPVFVDGRNFVVTGSARGTGSVDLVAWVRPDGRTQEICLTERVGEHRVVVQGADDHACQAVAEATSSLQGREMPVGTRKTSAGNTPDARRAFDLDLDGDGRPEHVDLFTWSSGGGCGSEGGWLEFGEHPSAGLAALSKATIDGAAPLALYRVDGRAFVLVSPMFTGTPEDLLTVRDGAVQHVCSFNRFGTWRVKKLLF